MEIKRIRTFWKGNDSGLLQFWKELVDLGHQRFRIEGADNGSWIDLFLPELLKYGIPKNNDFILSGSFLWPWPEDKPPLRPVFTHNKTSIKFFETAMYLDVNYYGVFYDKATSKFRGCIPRGDEKLSNIRYNDKLRHTALLRELGMPFSFFKDNQKYWPVIDFTELDRIYEYYFQDDSEV
jgi:hypothetical protein